MDKIINNKHGTVTKIDQSAVWINDVMFPTDTPTSIARVTLSHPCVGDEIEFNTRGKFLEIIYLRVTKPKWGYGRNYREARPHSRSSFGGSDDPEDYPLGNDLDAMGYHHLGMECD
jgi:hypothetical protein